MNTIEPPVLMSRIMTFVFAAALAVVVVLVITLTNLLPLSRTQIFFLTTQPRELSEITIKSFSPNDANIEVFKENFIKEYIKVRNEIIPNIVQMRRKWGTAEGGMVNMWSSQEVFRAFMQTRMWQRIMIDVPDSQFRCQVEFHTPAIDLRRRPSPEDSTSRYAVSFRYFCTDADNTGQPYEKDYTILIGIRFQERIRWTDRLENPLGVYVSEYRVESGGGDPLDFTQLF